MHYALDTIIRSFTKEEFREFKYFLKGRANVALERNDLKMIDAIRKGEEVKSTNATYQIRKRLKKQMELFVQIQHVKNDTRSAITNKIEVSRYLFKKDLCKEAWHYIKEAEHEAQKEGMNELIEYIYYIQITWALKLWPLANFDVIDIQQLIASRKENAKVNDNNMAVNSAYILLLHEIRELFSQKVFSNLNPIINELLKRYNIKNSLYNNPKTYILIVNMICRAFSESKDYKGLKEYAMNSFKIIQKQKRLDKVSPDQFLRLLRFIYQASVRTKDYKTAIAFQRVFNDKKECFLNEPSKYIYFDFRASIMAADVYLFTNKIHLAQKELQVLDAKYAAQNDNVIVYFLLRINQLALYFKLNNYVECIRLYSGLIQKYKKQILKEEGLGLEMLLYTEIYGVILYYENDDFDYAIYLIDKIKKRYFKEFKQSLQREFIFLKIMENMIKKTDYVKTAAFQSDVKGFVVLKKYIPGDKEYISLNAWLESKSHAQSYYTCFLKHT